MLIINGNRGRLCDGFTRRELLRVGGIGLLGLSIPNLLALQEEVHELLGRGVLDPQQEHGAAVKMQARLAPAVRQ